MLSLGGGCRAGQGRAAPRRTAPRYTAPRGVTLYRAVPCYTVPRRPPGGPLTRLRPRSPPAGLGGSPGSQLAARCRPVAGRLERDGRLRHPPARPPPARLSFSGPPLPRSAWSDTASDRQRRRATAAAPGPNGQRSGRARPWFRARPQPGPTPGPGAAVCFSGRIPFSTFREAARSLFSETIEWTSPGGGNRTAATRRRRDTESVPRSPRAERDSRSSFRPTERGPLGERTPAARGALRVFPWKFVVSPRALPRLLPPAAALPVPGRTEPLRFAGPHFVPGTVGAEPRAGRGRRSGTGGNREARGRPPAGGEMQKTKSRLWTRAGRPGRAGPVPRYRGSPPPPRRVRGHRRAGRFATKRVPGLRSRSAAQQWLLAEPALTGRLPTAEARSSPRRDRARCRSTVGPGAAGKARKLRRAARGNPGVRGPRQRAGSRPEAARAVGAGQCTAPGTGNETEWPGGDLSFPRTSRVRSP